MTSTDPIADMLTRIRNAISVNKTEVRVPYSKIKHTIATQLVESGFIGKVVVEGDGIAKALIITICAPGQNPNITLIERISKPGRRMYAKASEIPTVKRGRGIVIVSTSQGIMTGSDATSKNLGGELICKVY